MVNKRIEKLRRTAAYKNMEPFFTEIEQEYNVTRDEILIVVDDLGFIKGQIRTYFMVRAHQQGVKKNIDPDRTNNII